MANEIVKNGRNKVYVTFLISEHISMIVECFKTSDPNITLAFIDTRVCNIIRYFYRKRIKHM